MGKRVRTRDAAKYLGVSVSVLEKDRSSGKLGIPFHKIGRTVVYDLDELDAWLKTNRRSGGLSGA